MALKDKQYFENHQTMQVMLGGNGDYVIRVWYKDRNGLNQNVGFEVCTSGGPAPTSVKNAVAQLFRAMEEEGLNELPELK